MTKKQLAYLRKLAHNVTALYQIGKLGINENFVSQINDALEARELIKVSILDSSMISANQAAYEVAEKTNSVVVQVIGKKFSLYRESKENPIIVLP